jgi:hypothetical protein
MFSNIQDVKEAFHTQDLRDDEVVFAAYSSQAYNGTALVVFYRNGNLFSVDASHCSCNGLEDCWSPIRTVPRQLGAMEDYSLPDADGCLEQYRKLWPKTSLNHA